MPATFDCRAWRSALRCYNNKMPADATPASQVGAGSSRPNFDDLVARYERWVYAVASCKASVRSPEFEDVVQEARIAIWQAAGRADAARGGAHAKWLTQAAKWRMRDVARRSTWTGHTRSRGNAADPLLRPHASVEKAAEAGDPMLEAATSIHDGDIFDHVLVAYHQREIMEALASLPPAQRAYVVQRFWGGKSDTDVASDTGRSNSALSREWHSKIKPVLRERLANLESLAA